jgi:hypothetical protein
MAATFKFYGQALLKIFTGSIDLDTDTFKLMLTTSAYTPNQDTHDFRDDVTNEVTGTGYTAGGVTLTGVTVSYDAATNQVRISWNDPTWPNSTISARGAVIYKSRGGAASADELLAYAINDADVSSSGATFTVDLSSPTLFITAS